MRKFTNYWDNNHSMTIILMGTSLESLTEFLMSNYDADWSTILVLVAVSNQRSTGIAGDSSYL
jgi:hypothetical protein